MKIEINSPIHKLNGDVIKTDVYMTNMFAYLRPNVVFK